MNISRPTKIQKTRGQAMVEFALALPILLTLLYGLLETGRLLFIYASTVTAARQAVRYGSATGIGPNGVQYYQDCDGIVAAANNVGFINTFEDIIISYDGGLDSNNGNIVPLSPANPACGSFTEVQNGDRILVSVSSQWVPIVSIVPLEPFTITSQSERTILASVSISVTSVPQGWQGSGNGVLTLLSIVGSPDPYSAVGQATYIYTLKNTGSGELAGPFTVTDSIATTNCSGAAASLAVDAVTTCTGTYPITQADLDAGTVTNQATAYANGSPSINSPTETIFAAAAPVLALSKSASPIAASSAGTNITYTYTLSNTGNVTLTSPYTVADNKIASVNCSGAASPLAPGAATTCTASYSITDADINNGSVVNQAVASAKFKTTTVTSNSASATVNTSPLTLIISVSPPAATLANQVITYTYAISNNSGTTVNSLSVTDDKITVSCDNTTIAAGGSTNCTGTYTVTQAALDTGGTIINTATATGSIGSPVSSNTATASLVITQTPALSATVSGTPSQPPSPPTMPAGTVVTYTYTLTNTGNVTLTSPFLVSDNKTTITCSDSASMPPAGTKTCTGTYTVTTTDVAAGSIINTGTASAKFGAQTITSNPASFTVITYSDPRFNLTVTQNKTTVTPADLTITYTYTLTNTGGITLSKPYTISSSLQSTLLIAGTGGTNTTTAISPDCTSAAASIAPGISTNCTYTYTHPSVTGSSTLVNSAFAASIGGTPGTSSPASLTATAYNCTASNFTVGTLTVGSGSNKDKVTWAITNKVGLTLSISSVSIHWANSGSGSSKFQLDAVTLNNSSSLTTGLPPSDTSSPYTSGSGTLTGSGSAASVTTITFDFSKDNPSGLSASITMASPYGNCSR